MRAPGPPGGTGTLLLAAFLALSGPLRAQEAEPRTPLQVIERATLGSSAFTVGDGVVQLESSASYTTWKEGGAPSPSALYTLRYGLGADFELVLDTALDFKEGRLSDVEDPLPGLRWTFAEDGKSAYGLVASLGVPVGSPSQRARRPLPGLVFLADWSLGDDVDLGLNLGGYSVEDPDTGTFLVQSFTSACLSRTFDDLVSGYVEVSTQGPGALGGATTVTADAGLSFQVHPSFSVDLGLYRGLSATGTDWAGTMGFTSRW